MMCGSRCYIVEVEIDGQQKRKRVNARTPVNARKFIRNTYGNDVTILSAVAEKKNE